MEETRTNRSIEILLYLQGTGGRSVTVSNVMDSLQAQEHERQSVQRDLRLLAAIPQTGLKCLGKGRSLRYRMVAKPPENRVLTHQDLFTFLLFLRIQQRTLHGGAAGIKVFEDIFANTVRAITGLLGGTDPYGDMTARFGDLVWFTGEEIVAGPNPDVAPTLFQGLLERRKLEVEYGGMSDEIAQKRILEPWKLVIFRGELYFLSPRTTDRNKLLTFKLTRIHKARLLPDHFTIDTKVMSRYQEKHKTNAGLLGDETPKPVRITLGFNWELRHILQERKVHPTQKIILMDEDDKENRWVKVTLTAPVDEDLLEWIRKWGESVEVLGPAKVKDWLLGYAGYLQEMYGETESEA